MKKSANRFLQTACSSTRAKFKIEESSNGGFLSSNDSAPISPKLDNKSKSFSTMYWYCKKKNYFDSIEVESRWCGRWLLTIVCVFDINEQMG
jgi:hypothetical protein